MRILGDFDVAEEIVQDALLVALERWPVDGIPERPGAWLLTVARRRALNQLSRDARYREKLAQLEQPILQEPDDRVRLMFTCCHPALSRAAQVALTLRAVCGFTTSEIAHAFLVSEAVVAQRIVRARRKIVVAHIPYRMPNDDEMGERLREVLAVLYLMFNEGYLASSGATPTRATSLKMPPGSPRWSHGTCRKSQSHSACSLSCACTWHELRRASLMPGSWSCFKTRTVRVGNGR